MKECCNDRNNLSVNMASHTAKCTVCGESHRVFN